MNEEALRVQSIQDFLLSFQFILKTDDDAIVRMVINSRNIYQTFLQYIRSPLIEEQKKALECVGHLVSSDEDEIIDKLLFDGMLTIFDEIVN